MRSGRRSSAGMTIYSGDELKAFLENAGFCNVQIHQKQNGLALRDRTEAGGIRNAAANDSGRTGAGGAAGLGVRCRHPPRGLSAWRICMTKRCRSDCIALGLTTKGEDQTEHAALQGNLHSIYLFYVLLCVYAINGAQTFWGGFWRCFVILSVMNLIDRLGIDGYWVGHTKGVGNSGDRGSDAVHLEIRQAEEMAVRNTGNGRDFPAPCGTRAAAVRRKYRCQRKRPNFRKREMSKDVPRQANIQAAEYRLGG